MYAREQKIAVVEQTAFPRIVLLLKREGKASRTDLKIKIQASQTAIYNALSLLTRYELIKEIPPTGAVNRIDITLTEKGEKVAECFETLEKLL